MLNPTSAPTSRTSSTPTMMNQRTIRTGRARGLSVSGLPEIWGSVTIFMSCTFCGYLWCRLRRAAAQMRGDGGLMKSNAAQEELAQLAFEIGRVAVGQTGHRRNARQGRHQHGVVGKPEQIE